MLVKTNVRSAIRIIPVHPSVLTTLHWVYIGGGGNGIMIVVFRWNVVVHVKLLNV